MVMLLLLVLILTEIGFAAFALSGKFTRGEWAMRRLCVSAVELLAYLVMTLLPGIDFSFRFMGILVILVLQLIFSAIFWLIKRKNTDRSKSDIGHLGYRVGYGSGVYLYRLQGTPSDR